MWNEEVGRFASSAALTPPPTLPLMDPLLWKRLRDELAGVNGRDGSASDARASRRALAADDRDASAMALRISLNTVGEFLSTGPPRPTAEA
jgi:hypothetical protein